MTQVEITGNRLKVEMLGWYKIWALKSRLEFPMEHVSGVRQVPDLPWLGGIRMGGTALPGVIKSGRYYRNGLWEFWVMHHRDRMIEIDLQDESYARLYLEVEDPEQTIRLIEQEQERFKCAPALCRG